jgi:hypothetical protein
LTPQQACSSCKRTCGTSDVASISLNTAGRCAVVHNRPQVQHAPDARPCSCSEATFNVRNNN